MALRYESDRDEEQKLRYFRLAAGKGVAEAQYRLALLIENVLDREAPGNEEAFRWIKAAADQDHTRANFCLGNYHRNGTGVDVDYEKAFDCYLKVIELEDPDGFQRIGECHATGRGVSQDDEIAFICFRIAAEMGSPMGQCDLGIFYLEGRGCRQDTELGFQWISQAVDSGHPQVFQTLQGGGLDIARLCNGYKRSQQFVSKATGDWFGDTFDRVLNDSQMSILAVAPGEKP